MPNPTPTPAPETNRRRELEQTVVPVERVPLGRRIAGGLTRTGSWARANAFLAVLFVVAAGLFYAAVAGVGELYEVITADQGITPVDQAVQTWALAHRPPTWTHLVAFYSNTGGPVLQPIITGLIVIVLALRWRSWTPIVLMVIAEGGAIAMTAVGKHLAGRARPPLDQSVPPYEYSPSFPSGHTLNATVIAIVLFYLLAHRFRARAVRLTLGILAGLYAVTMGLSRVFLGHHWLTDVVAGWLLSAMWASLVIALHVLWVTTRRRLHPNARWNAIGADRPEPKDDHVPAS